MPERVAAATRAARRAWRAAAWYANGLTGESRYEAYLAHERAAHPERPPLDRRAFWRDYHRMTAAGVRFVRPPSEEPYGVVAVFKDLYGNLWDLVQPRGQG